ncbi:hypothetical protein SLEP1_g39586 [Rubroshorea leprosula]|uniref:Pentatricopeptide repeat-containing protein n=1 Tax=Rubroshorea leprosula TaxID=152421 RepID=A0AAV5L0N6_9ROSI|nr:hypothetical protein SLEP1_g39586 [Rubroshorea leprosula]
MSSIFRVLRSNFSPTSGPSIRFSAKDIFRERNIRSLVEKFKILSESKTFRHNTHAYDYTFRRLAAAGHLNWIEEILEDQKKYIPISKEGFAGRLITLYGKSGMFDHAQKLFDEIPERGLVSFNALLGAYVNSKKFCEVNRLFKKLPEKLSIKPDVSSYNAVIRAFCEMGSLDLACLMLDEMENEGVEPNEITFNTLLFAFYKNGRFFDGEKIWHRMVENRNVVPNISSYNSKLLGLVAEKRTKEAVELVQNMGKFEGLKPDLVSFNSLIGCFVNEGNLKAAKQLYIQMLISGCLPDKVTFELLVPLVCRKGDVDFAFQLCRKIFGRSFSRRFVFDESLLQQVVDELVKSSKIEEARKLVQLGETNKYHQYMLKLPAV